MMDQNEVDGRREIYNERIRKIERLRATHEDAANAAPLSMAWRSYWMGFFMGLGFAVFAALTEQRQPWFEPVTGIAGNYPGAKSLSPLENARKERLPASSKISHPPKGAGLR